MAPHTFDSPLFLFNTEFQALISRPDPPRVRADEIGLSPAGLGQSVGLGELGALLRDRSTSDQVKNRAWALLCDRAVSAGGDWTVAAVGIALPGLVGLAVALARDEPGLRPELDRVILDGFLTAIQTATPDGTATPESPTPRARSSAAPGDGHGSRQRFPVLLRATRRTALAWLHTRSEIPTADLAELPETPQASSGAHPELALADAVASGVITASEAELIAATRLDGTSLAELARRDHRKPKTLWMRRERAEKRLVAALTAAGVIDRQDTEADPTYTQALAAIPLEQRTRLSREMRAVSARRATSPATAHRTTGGSNAVTTPFSPQPDPSSSTAQLSTAPGDPNSKAA
jgi:hypothetical protein